MSSRRVLLLTFSLTCILLLIISAIYLTINTPPKSTCLLKELETLRTQLEDYLERGANVTFDEHHLSNLKEQLQSLVQRFDLNTEQSKLVSMLDVWLRNLLMELAAERGDTTEVQWQRVLGAITDLAETWGKLSATEQAELQHEFHELYRIEKMNTVDCVPKFIHYHE